MSVLQEKAKRTIRTREDAIEVIKTLVKENSEAFRGVKVALYGDYLDQETKTNRGELGIVLEAIDGTPEYGKDTMIALDRLKASLNNRVTVYWFNSMRERDEQRKALRARHGLTGDSESIYEDVAKNRLPLND